MSTCYSNASPVYKPAMRLISAISTINPVEITTTIDHGYTSGLIVRVTCPNVDGMSQINKLTGIIAVTGATTFTMPIDATAFDIFAIPGAPGAHDFTCAQVIPIAEASDMLSEATRNIL